jgi:uncharacterized membrane protein HdeD (DUF308 family)
MARLDTRFGALVATQAAHSVEEYVGRLWESFPPARFLTGLVSSDREWGFIVINVTLVVFGIWCFLFPLRRRWPSAIVVAWIWVVIEVVNGVGHPLWSLQARGYTPGVVTAPLLLALALYLARGLRAGARPVPASS